MAGVERLLPFLGMNSHLSPAEIEDRIIRFNQTNDWTVFNDVPEDQQVDVLYPHIINFDKLILNSVFPRIPYDMTTAVSMGSVMTLVDLELQQKITEDGKRILNELFGKLGDL